MGAKYHEGMSRQSPTAGRLTAATLRRNAVCRYQRLMETKNLAFPSLRVRPQSSEPRPRVLGWCVRTAPPAGTPLLNRYVHMSATLLRMNSKRRVGVSPDRNRTTGHQYSPLPLAAEVGAQHRVRVWRQESPFCRRTLTRGASHRDHRIKSGGMPLPLRGRGNVIAARTSVFMTLGIIARVVVTARQPVEAHPRVSRLRPPAVRRYRPAVGHCPPASRSRRPEALPYPPEVGRRP
jgi:hypothetical protein